MTSLRHMKYGIWFLMTATCGLCILYWNSVNTDTVDLLHVKKKDVEMRQTEEQRNVLDSTSVGRRMAERRRHFLQFCQLKQPVKVGYENITKNLLYSEKRKFVYCKIEKCATSFWKALFQIVAGMTNVTDPFTVPDRHTTRYPTIQQLPIDTQLTVLTHSTKFIIVREPYSRLLSAYLNKLYQIDLVYWQYGSRIIKTIRPNASQKSLKCGHDVTFPEFVKYFIYTTNQRTDLDRHFEPASHLCSPCQVNYDLIAKMETFQEDTLYVVNLLNVTDVPQLQEKLRTMEADGDFYVVGLMARNILYLVSTTSCLGRSEGIRRTWKIFQFRGFIGKDVKYPLTKDEEETIDADGLEEMFMTALKSVKREGRQQNRHLVLQEAYSLIPLHDLKALSQIFHDDCGAFGYDCEPDYIFNKTRNSAEQLFLKQVGEYY